jgi:CubicO group peptidase (beta-lactamase class C family)
MRTALLLAVLSLFWALPATAEPSSEQSEANPPPIDANALPVASNIDPRLRGTVEGLFSGLVGSGEIPGAVIIVIRNGEVSFKAGFGFADIDARKPVDPAKTRFRAGSISKLFTATAVMQLVEAGKLDLNSDVNTYLTSFKIPPTYPEPVTLSHILTHTAGFDDRYLGIAAPLSEKVEPLRQYLSLHMPPRVLPPGKYFAYSNHGFALAGLIVEEVSGEGFNDYVQKHIFAPLRMTQSTFGVPDPVPPDIAVPYSRSVFSPGFSKIDLDRLRIGPAGDLVTTAPDLAKFMIAQLRRGAGLLSAETADFMQSQHFVQAQGLDGWAYGFAEGERNNVRWIGHGGSWPGFCADLVLVPEKQSGYFIAYNTDCHFAASQPIRKTMFDAMWRGEEPKIGPADTADAIKRAAALAGSYITARRARSDFTIISAASSEAAVVAKGDGNIEIDIPDVGRPLLFEPRADGLWENPDFGWRATALTDANGKVVHLAINAAVFDRVGFFDNWGLWAVGVNMALLVAFLAWWGWTNGFVSRRLFAEPEAMIGFMPRLAGYLGVTLTLILLISFVVMLSLKPVVTILHGPDTFMRALLFLPIGMAICAVPMAIWSVVGFGDSVRARFAQVGYALSTIAIFIVLLFAWHWNMHPFAGRL